MAKQVYVSVLSYVNVNIHDNSTSNNTFTFLKFDGILICRTRVVTVLPKHVLSSITRITNNLYLYSHSYLL